MPQGTRPERVGEEIRQEISLALARDVQDPRIGFVTITRVKMSPDLQQARLYYTTIGDEKERRETAKGLERAKSFLRRHVAHSVRLRRVPELTFEFDRSVEHQDRVEQLILEIEQERRARGESVGPEPTKAPGESDGDS